jgi:hypothetical protein
MYHGYMCESDAPLLNFQLLSLYSGMGVALSILGNNTSSLVGVAISASLLPPAVNAGICWAHAILIRAGRVENISQEDFWRIGGISFALTVVNIVCIWVSGILMFAIKEVAPSKSKSAFWARDIKVARAIQKGSQEVNLDVIKAGLQDALERDRRAKTEGTANGGAPDGAASIASRFMRRRNQRQASSKGASNFSFNLATNPVDDVIPIVDTQKIGLVGSTPLTDDLRYVGLEDMAALLGFDEDEEEEAPAQNSGWGFGWLR